MCAESSRRRTENGSSGRAGRSPNAVAAGFRGDRAVTAAAVCAEPGIRRRGRTGSAGGRPSAIPVTSGRQGTIGGVHGDGHDFDRWRARGDADALARVFDARAPALMRSAVHLVGDVNTAEDLVQETFLTALRRADHYDVARPIERWLGGILARHAQEVRREARRTVPRELPERWHEHTPLDDALSAEERELVARALDRLSEPYRSAAVLHVTHGLSAPEIAHVLERSPGAVRVQLHRAREILRATLPIGMAGALALMSTPARGLEMVRNQVLEDAARLAPAAGAGGALLGGAIAMKKVVLSAVVLLVLLSVFLALRPNTPVDAEPAVVAQVTVDSVQSAKKQSIAVPEPLEDDERRTVASASAATAGELQPFRCRVVDALTGKRVPDARIAFYAPKLGLWSEARTRWLERFTPWIAGYERTHDWPWFRAEPTLRQRLDLDPILSYEGPFGGDAPVATATTGADGEAVVDLSPEQAFVVVEHPGYATRGMAPVLERTISWRRGDKYEKQTFRDDALVVKLFQPRALHGQVIDLDGTPIARRIALRLEGWGPGDVLEPGETTSQPVDSWTIETEADGSFATQVGATKVRIRSLETGWTVAASARDPNRGAVRYFGADRETGTGETTWVPLLSVPTLTVRNAADGTPIRDYWLQMRMPQNGWAVSPLMRVRAADGRTAIVDDRDLGRARGNREFNARAYHVFAPGFVPGVVESADPASSNGLELALQPGVCPTIEGRVHEGGRPLAGADLLLEASATRDWDCEMIHGGASVRSDSEGRFSFPVAPGGWVVRVDDGDRSQCRYVEVPSSEPLAIDLGIDTRIEIVVEGERGSFDGAFAVVSAKDGTNRSASLDTDGRARIGSLSPGRYTAHVHGKGVEFRSALGEAELDLAAGDVRTLHFTLAPLATPRHALLVVDGRASLAGWKARRYGSAQWSDVEPDGRALLEPGGDQAHIDVLAPDALSYQFRVDPGDVQPVLRLSPSRGAREGVLRGDDGRPQTSFSVSVVFRPDERGLQRVASPVDAEGRFRLDALPSDARIFVLGGANGEDRAGYWESIVFECPEGAGAPSSPLVIDLPPGVDVRGVPGVGITLSGTVRARGAPDGGRKLWISAVYDRPGGTLSIAAMATALSDGSYVLRTLPAPRHSVSYRMGPSPFEQEFTLPLDVPEARRDFDVR